MTLPEGQIYIGYDGPNDYKYNRDYKEALNIVSIFIEQLTKLNYDVLVRSEEYAFVIEYNDNYNRALQFGSNAFITASEDERELIINKKED